MRHVTHRYQIAAALVATTLTALPAYAVGSAEVLPVRASFAEDTGNAERIEAAEFIRTYTQEAVAAACFLHHDVDPDLSRSLLEDARTGFEKHIDALLNGNEEMGIIGGETRKKTIVGLNKIAETWAPVANAIDALTADPSDVSALENIKAADARLFKMSDKLVSVIETSYSNPAEVMQSDVMTIEIVGRQAMMSQKIAKYACKIYSGNASEEVMTKMSRAIDIYERSLQALIHGLPELGIRPAPTPEIDAKLSAVLSEWNAVRPQIETMIAEASVERDVVIDLFRHMSKEMKQLEDITHDYVKFSKH